MKSPFIVSHVPVNSQFTHSVPVTPIITDAVILIDDQTRYPDTLQPRTHIQTSLTCPNISIKQSSNQIKQPLPAPTTKVVGSPSKNSLCLSLLSIQVPPAKPPGIDSVVPSALNFPNGSLTSFNSCNEV